ncbi:twitching motility protein PilT [Lacrimispora saccharolytica]|uniref:twitching motility protein PilT n=1 Tax=Lacrimispora saccharolytica TaxID=84030 RepID=UPI00265C9F2A|nr:twitching motility protein PilT [Lacrimispora saccharolytica]MCF2656190.1 twitching motility protein PilT [Lacrimispora saccharolytica]MCI7557542.1 twitching motility protein PilT [Lachnospiraceae bacterium]MDD7547533.1 twitching motility protein PilT [Lachnospiraceae bacterium]MDY4126690.1 twitching motility protein PilT [Lachnospiraceae bacterium]
MIQLIVGEEGKGKTKHLLDKVNSEIKEATGNIVFLDRSSKHMFELNNKVRLINVSEYDFEDVSEFIGFIYGITSQDHDMQQMYIDGIMKLAKLDKDSLEIVVKRLEKISEKFGFDIIISASIDESKLSDNLKKLVIVSL